MDWNSLKTFIAIAEQQTLAGAARVLGVNHSTVFRRLNQFEKAIGSRLFERLNEGYQLTEAGEALLQQSEPIANAFDSLERYIVGQDYKPQGKVRITAPSNIAYAYLPEYLTAFQQKYPGMHLELIVSNEPFSLTKREADIAVRATDRPPQHLAGRKVARLPWSLYASDNYAGELPASLDALDELPLIGGEGRISGLPPFQWLDKHYPHSLVARSNNLVAIAAMVRAGLGLALLPDDNRITGLRALLPGEADWFSDLWLLTHPDLRRVERIRLLMRYLYDCFTADPRLLHCVEKDKL